MFLTIDYGLMRKEFVNYRWELLPNEPVVLVVVTL